MEKQLQEFRKKYNVTPELLQKMVMPEVGQYFVLGEVTYRVEFVRPNPYRFTAVPVYVKEKEGNNGQ